MKTTILGVAVVLLALVPLIGVELRNAPDVGVPLALVAGEAGEIRACNPSADPWPRIALFDASTAQALTPACDTCNDRLLGCLELCTLLEGPAQIQCLIQCERNWANCLATCPF